MAIPDRIDELRTLVEGAVVVRGEPGYPEAVSGFNTRSPIAPDVVVSVTSERDIQEAVRFAGDHDLPVSIMATGHGSYRPVDRGLLIRTDRLSDVTVDPVARTFTIGAGARWWDILPRLGEFGLTAVTGSSPSVGAVGLTLGGGVGPLSRTLGWAADRAVSYRIVNAAGEPVVASADENPELFRALKGGKVGLGVVAEMTLEAVALPEVYAGGLFFAEEHIEAVHRAWVDWAPTLPEAANTSIAILRLPDAGVPEPLAGRTVAHVRFAYVDPALDAAALADAGEGLLAAIRDVAPVHLDAIGVLPTADVGTIHAEPFGPLPIWEYGEFLDPVDQEYATAVLRHAGAGLDTPFAAVETRLLGGAVARRPAAPNSIGGSRAAYALLALAMVTDDSADDADRAGAALFADVAAYAHAEVNYNWAGHPADRFHRLWAPETAGLLARVRAEQDPHGRFAF